MKKSARVIFHVDMDAFFPSVEELLHPEYTGKALIVGADPIKGRGVVSSCSYEARKYGVKSAMPISKAFELCPHGIFVRGTPDAYVDYSNKIKNIFLKYSPAVQMASLDEAYIDFTGFQTLYNNIGQVALNLKHEIKEKTGLSCSIGVARSKVVAKVASDHDKPGGITNVLDRDREFLYPLPISSLPLIGPKMQESLKSMGISKIGQLAGLDRRVMEKLFGKLGATIWNYANAKDDTKVTTTREVKSVGRERTFENDVIEYDNVKSALVYTLERALYDLRKKNFKAKTVTVKLRYRDFTTITRSKTIPAGDTFNHFFPVVLKLLDKMWTRNVRIRLIGVRFNSLEDSCQKELFDFNRTLKRKMVDEKVDNLRGRYGFHIVKPASILK